MAIIRLNGKVLEILCLSKMKVNDRDVEFNDGFIKLDSLDKILFPCDGCRVPHFYHLIYAGSDQSKD